MPIGNALTRFVRGAWRRLVSFLSSWQLNALVALLVIASFIVPWNASGQHSYPGLDPRLMFVNAKGTATQAGKVSITGNTALLSATSDSNPTLHIVDSETNFSADFDMVTTASGEDWSQASVMVQAPQNARYLALLIGAVGGTVQFRDIKVTPVDAADTPTGSPIFEDRASAPKLGPWASAPSVARSIADPEPGYALQLDAPGTQEADTYSRSLSQLHGGSYYAVSALVRSTNSLPRFKIAVLWLNANRVATGVSADWPDWAKFTPAPFVPADVRLWFPAHGNTMSLQFVSGSQRDIAVVLVDSHGTRTQDLGTYQLDQTYHVSVRWSQASSAEFAVTNPAGEVLRYVISRSSGFDLFTDPFVNFSVSASAPPHATTGLTLRNVTLAVPDTTRFSSRPSDPEIAWIALTALIYLALQLLIAIGRGRSSQTTVAKRARSRKRVVLTLALGSIVCASLVGVYFASSLVDGHPFDRLSQGSALYVINGYGLGALYQRTALIPDAAIRGGTVPWSPAEFVYPPGMANFFVLVGSIWRWLGGNLDPIGNRAFYDYWKFCYALFLLPDAALIYAILRRLDPSRAAWRWAMTLGFAFNPAMIFDTAVWGQSNALLLTPLLVAAYAVVARKPKLMWAALLIAVTIKQTALLIAPVLIVFALREFGFRRNVDGLAFGLIAAFAFMSPALFAGYAPSTLVLTTAGKLIDFGTPLTHYTTQVSADTFPVWVIFTGLAGLHGHDRLWASDAAFVPNLHITYADAGLVIFGFAVVIALLAAWRAGRRDSPAFRYLFVATAVVSVAYVSFNTRTSGHYLTLAIPFLLMGLRPSLVPVGAWRVVAVSAVVLMSEYGLFMFIAANGEWPYFAVLGSPTSNSVSQTIFRLYVSDSVITFLSALLLVVALSLLWGAVWGEGARHAVRSHSTRPLGAPA